MKQFYCLFIVFLLNSCGTESRNEERTSVTERQLSKLAEDLKAADINFQPDSSQLTINIINSQLVEQLLKKSTTEQPDSVYLVAMELGQRLNELLNKQHEYDNLHLSFQANEQQNYYFNFCLRNCE